MPDRWTACCERIVPRVLRASAFEPAVADLRAEYLERARDLSGLLQCAARVTLHWRILAAALECRRLGVASVPTIPHPPRVRGTAMWTDLRSAVRSVRRSPALTTVIVLILAVGIGANVAVFSFANTFLIAPLPVEQPDRLVRVYARSPEREFDVVSFPAYRDIRDAVSTLALAAHTESPVRVGLASERLTATAELVTGNFFAVMRVAPHLGRLITPSDDLAEGAHPVIVLGETLWRTRFNADPAVVGSTLAVNGLPFQVIGIAPAGFRGAASAYAVSDLWAPLAMHREVRPRGASRENRNWGWLSMIGRVKDGVPIAAVAPELARAASDLNRGTSPQHAMLYDVTAASALPEADRQRVVRVLGLAAGLTGLILVAACANLAGVVQTRLHGRRRELAVRRAMGAGPVRLVRMLFLEMLLLALAAGASGLAGGRAAAALIDRWRPPAQLIGDISFATALDWRVLAFAVMLTVFCAAAFGLAPALSAARAPASSLLKDDGPTSTGGRRGARLRHALIVVQVGIAVVLLLAGGLLVRSALTLNQVDPGFETANLAVFGVDLRTQHVPAPQGRPLIEDALQRVRALPGVAEAGIATSLPLGFGKNRQRVRVPGHVGSDGATSVPVAFTRVGRTYFEALGIPIERGQVWSGSADASAAAVVINQTMARRFWAGRDPVGSSLEIVGGPVLTVAGIARDSVYYELGEAPLPFMYLPAESAFPDAMAIVVRTTVPVGSVLATIEREIGAVDDRLAPSPAGAFEDLRRIPMYPARAFASIAVTFGALALVLTAVGLYGVIASAVGQRTREFGVRLALGATGTQVVAGVLRGSIALAAVGAGFGLVAGYFATGAFRALLFGVSAFDPLTYAAVAGIVAVVTMIAAWLPARRAARIDPVAALRA